MFFSGAVGSLINSPAKHKVYVAGVERLRIVLPCAGNFYMNPIRLLGRRQCALVFLGQLLVACSSTMRSSMKKRTLPQVGPNIIVVSFFF
jgi:hypothetical protein